MWRLVLLIGVLMLTSRVVDAKDVYVVRNCSMRIDGHVYIHGKCKIRHDLDNALDSWFFRSGKFFGYILTTDPNTPQAETQGTWNGKEAETHAQAPLGVMHKKDSCWINYSAKICISDNDK